MGQKVSPHGLRVGINKNWDSRWFAGKDKLAEYIKEDNEIRKFMKKELNQADLSRVEIERVGDKLKLNLFTAKPGMVIGKGGKGIDELKEKVEKFTHKNVFINIEEIKNPDADAQLVAEKIANALERRIAFRRAMKQSMQRTMRTRGVKGIKVSTSGRLGGAEIARSEGYAEGVVPLHTLRADIDYGFAEADTTYGKLGVKVWICKGEILKDRNGEKRDFDALMGNKDEKKKKARRRPEGENGQRENNHNNRKRNYNNNTNNQGRTQQRRNQPKEV